MSKKEVERFLIAGGEDKVLRLKYDKIGDMSKFVAAAVEDGVITSYSIHYTKLYETATGTTCMVT